MIGHVFPTGASKRLGLSVAWTALTAATSFTTFAGCGDATRDEDAPHALGSAADEAPPAGRVRDVASTRLDVDFREKRAVALVTFGASSTAGATLDVSGLTIRTVEHDGAPVPFALRRGADVRRTYLDLDVPAGPSYAVTIAYGYTVWPDISGGETHWGDVASTFTWPDRCGYLFPCNPAPGDGLTFELQMTGIPVGAMAVFPTSIPADAPPSMAAWAVGDYRYYRVGASASGIEVGFYSLPRGVDRGERSMAHVPRLVDWFEEHVGPYAFGDKIASVEVPRRSAALSSYPDLNAPHHPYWHVPATRFDAPQRQAEELSLGWFGSAVRVPCWSELTLSEGTASYLAAAALEATGEPTVGARAFGLIQSRLRDAAAYRRPATCTDDALPAAQSVRLGRFKVAGFYVALEKRVSRDALVAAMGKVYARRRGATATFQEILDQVALDTGYDPNWCADYWLKRTGIPPEPECL